MSATTPVPVLCTGEWQNKNGQSWTYVIVGVHLLAAHPRDFAMQTIRRSAGDSEECTKRSTMHWTNSTALIARFAFAMKLDSTNPMPYYMAYAVYKRRRLPDKQLSVLEAALKIDDANPFGHYEKAAMLEDAKNWRASLKEYETAQSLFQQLKSNPSNVQHGSWRYIDQRGNPYDITVQQSQIAADLDRVRKEVSN